MEATGCYPDNQYRQKSVKRQPMGFRNLGVPPPDALPDGIGFIRAAQLL
jgi:hypothetical protein